MHSNCWTCKAVNCRMSLIIHRANVFMDNTVYMVLVSPVLVLPGEEHLGIAPL